MVDTREEKPVTRYWILRVDPAHSDVNVALEESADAEMLVEGDRVVVMCSANEVTSLIEVSDDATANSDIGTPVRHVRILHRFEPSFRTVAQIEATALLDASTNEQAKWIVKEVLEAARGDGFTVDWSPLVNYF